MISYKTRTDADMNADSRRSKQDSFKNAVLAVVQRIPNGRVFTYKEVARRAGRPNAYRAVGNILKKNYNPDIPCHRVIRSDLPAPRLGIYFVYAILCDDNSMYIGYTQDLQKRWRAHCDGTGSDHTKKHKPIKVIHYEKYLTREEAVYREKGLKTGFGRKWLKREWKAGRTRQAGGKLGGYNRGLRKKAVLLRKEGISLGKD